MPPGARSDGLGLTRVGLGFVVLTGIVVVAATNTGNNGLYLALAAMAGVLSLAHVVGVANVRGLELTVSPPSEAWAGRPAGLGVEVASKRRWGGHRLFRVELDARDVEPEVASSDRSARWVLEELGAGQRRADDIGLWMPRRGRYRLRWVTVRSLHPWGFFRKGRSLPIDVEFLVYPALDPRGVRSPVQPGRAGEHPSRRAGWGHELLGLREYREGDDPRDIHWKQSARTRELMVRERETERSRRLQIVLDNGVTEAPGAAQRERFERLVSAAATAAVDHLEQGHEVALATRDGVVDFAAGKPQRDRVLEALAVVELRAGETGELVAADSTLPHLRLAVADPEVAA